MSGKVLLRYYSDYNHLKMIKKEKKKKKAKTLKMFWNLHGAEGSSDLNFHEYSRGKDFLMNNSTNF